MQINICINTIKEMGSKRKIFCLLPAFYAYFAPLNF